VLGKEREERIGEKVVLRCGDEEVSPLSKRNGRRDGYRIQVRGVIRDHQELGIILMNFMKVADDFEANIEAKKPVF
jgi:hypothetical protein